MLNALDSGRYGCATRSRLAELQSSSQSSCAATTFFGIRIRRFDALRGERHGLVGVDYEERPRNSPAILEFRRRIWAAATVSAINPNVKLQETAEPTEYCHEAKTGSRPFPKTMSVVCQAGKGSVAVRSIALNLISDLRRRLLLELLSPPITRHARRLVNREHHGH